MRKNIILVLFILFTTSNFSGYSQTNRLFNSQSQRQPDTNRKKQPKKKDSEVWADYLKKELSLDDLQHVAVKSIYDDNSSKIQLIINSEGRIQEKRDQMRDVTDQMNEKVIRLLSPDQKKKYQELLEEQEKKILTH